MRRTSNSRSDYAHPAAVITGPVLSELRGLRLCTQGTLPDIVHETYEATCVTENDYTATTIQNGYAGENAGSIRNMPVEAMTLPAKARWRAASDKEVASLKK